MAAPTLQTIADRAKVSRMTVSRALRNDPAISKPTRDRVHKIAAQVGYRPNPLVSALMASLQAAHPPRHASLLAFFTSAPTENGWRKLRSAQGIYDGAEAHATSRGYQLTPVWIREPEMTFRRLDRILRSRGVEGILVGTMARPMSHLRLDWSRYAVVTLGHTLSRPAFHRVSTNHFQAVSLALRTLRHRGYRRIGLVLSPWTDKSTQHAVLGGFYVHQHHAPPAGRVAVFYSGKEEGAAARFAAWRKRARPDAVVVHNPGDVLPWMKELGLAAPRDFGLVFLQPEGSRAAYACVERNFEAVGAAAAARVIDQLHRNERGVPAHSEILLIDNPWREGRSIRPKGTAELPEDAPSEADPDGP